jgi:hypothetical protein
VVGRWQPPPGRRPRVDLSDTTQILFAGHPLVVASQVVSCLLYAVAAVSFTRRAGADPSDELMRWLGAGCALAAVARVDYVLFPSLYSDFVHLGDTFRLGFYVCLLVGGPRESARNGRARRSGGRRTPGPDLHDGLTQELTYLYAQAQRLQTHPEDRRTPTRISGAAGERSTRRDTRSVHSTLPA